MRHRHTLPVILLAQWLVLMALFFALSADAQIVSCTDGVDCYCDCVEDTDGPGNNVGGYANTTCQTLYGVGVPIDSAALGCEDNDAVSLNCDQAGGECAPYWGLQTDPYGPPSDIDPGDTCPASQGSNGTCCASNSYIREKYAGPTGTNMGWRNNQSCTVDDVTVTLTAAEFSGPKVWAPGDPWGGNSGNEGCFTFPRQPSDFNAERAGNGIPDSWGTDDQRGVWQGRGVMGLRLPGLDTSTNACGILGFVRSSAQPAVAQLGYTQAYAITDDADESCIYGNQSAPEPNYGCPAGNQPQKHTEYGPERTNLFMGTTSGPQRPFVPTLRCTGGSCDPTVCANAIAAADEIVGTLHCVGNVQGRADFSKWTDWPDGDWGCVRGYYDTRPAGGITWKVWLNEDLIFHVENLDKSIFPAPDGVPGGMDEIVFNSYSNANGSAGPKSNFTMKRYHDNQHWREGEPVSCAQIGFTEFTDPFPLQIVGDRIQDQQGNDFKILADAAWELSHNTTTADVDNYIADRAAKGLTALLVRGPPSKFGNLSNTSPNDRLDLAGNLPWGDLDQPFISMDPGDANSEAAWGKFDYVVQQAKANGMVVIWTPAYRGFGSDGVGSNQGYESDIVSLTPQQAIDYGEWVATRYLDEGNIIWAHGGDTNNGDTTAVQRVADIRTGIDNVWTGAIHVNHAGRNVRGATSVYGAPNVDTVYGDCTTGSSSNTLIGQNFEAAAGSIPHFEFESRYENNNTITPAGCQVGQTWWNLLAGGMGGVPGNEGVWCFEGVSSATSRCRDFNARGDPDWNNNLSDPGVLTHALVPVVDAIVPLENLVADTGGSALCSSRNAQNSPAFEGCAHTPGIGMVAFFPTQSTINISTSPVGSGMTTTWYPAQQGGANSQSGPALSGATNSVTPPGSGEWVLVGVPSAGPTWMLDSVVPSPTSCEDGQPECTNVDVTLTASGDATGSILWELDCGNDGTYELTDTNTSNPYTFTNACSFSGQGVKTLAARTTREAVVGTNTGNFNVTGPPGSEFIKWDFETGAACNTYAPVGHNPATNGVCNYTPALIGSFSTAIDNTGGTGSGWTHLQVDRSMGPTDVWDVTAEAFVFEVNDAGAAVPIGLYNKFGTGAGSDNEAVYVINDPALLTLDIDNCSSTSGPWTYAGATQYALSFVYDRGAGTAELFVDGTSRVTASGCPTTLDFDEVRYSINSNGASKIVADNFKICENSCAAVDPCAGHDLTTWYVTAGTTGGDGCTQPTGYASFPELIAAEGLNGTGNLDANDSIMVNGTFGGDIFDILGNFTNNLLSGISMDITGATYDGSSPIEDPVSANEFYSLIVRGNANGWTITDDGDAFTHAAGGRKVLLLRTASTSFTINNLGATGEVGNDPTNVGRRIVHATDLNANDAYYTFQNWDFDVCLEGAGTDNYYDVVEFNDGAGNDGRVYGFLLNSTITATCGSRNTHAIASCTNTPDCTMSGNTFTQTGRGVGIGGLTQPAERSLITGNTIKMEAPHEQQCVAHNGDLTVIRFNTCEVIGTPPASGNRYGTRNLRSSTIDTNSDFTSTVAHNSMTYLQNDVTEAHACYVRDENQQPDAPPNTASRLRTTVVNNAYQDGAPGVYRNMICIWDSGGSGEWQSIVAGNSIGTTGAGSTVGLCSGDCLNGSAGARTDGDIATMEALKAPDWYGNIECDDPFADAAFTPNDCLKAQGQFLATFVGPCVGVGPCTVSNANPFLTGLAFETENGVTGVIATQDAVNDQLTFTVPVNAASGDGLHWPYLDPSKPTIGAVDAVAPPEPGDPCMTFEGSFQLYGSVTLECQ